jgi:hypothetical protein
MPSLNTANVQLYSYINATKVCINALADYVTPYVVNLGFEPKTNGTFSIKAEELTSFNATANIILEDLITNTTQNLMQNPNYSFTAATTDIVNRFKLYFDLTPNAVNTIASNANADNNIYSFDNSIYIKSLDKINAISVYNMLGQEILKLQHPTSNVLTLNQKSGYYTVRVICSTNVYSQKVYLK